MAAAHLVHVAVFATTGAARAALDASTLRWRDGVALTHAVTFVLAMPLAIVALRARKNGAPQLLGPLLVLLYLLHGAVIVGVDQLTVTGVTPFVGYAFGLAVVVPLTPRMAALLYSIGLAVFVAAIVAMQPSPTVRLATLPNGASIVAVCVALAFVLDGVRRRDFMQRVTIDEQRAALAQLNASLEQRLQEQVSEIVRRAEEVQKLNAQLTAQVRTRSTELSLALGKLARQRDTGGLLRRGLVLGDRFEIHERIGEGGMGTVYSGLDRTTGEPVAIKVVQASSTQELDALHRFLREAASAAMVVHPAVVRMLHVDVSDDGMLFQVQELVDGVTLQQRVRSGRRWEPGPVARLGAVLCDALASAHARGVVHRDVKPANVMLTRSAPGLKLLDFGIAKLFEDAAGGEAGTRTGMILGTPAFMAPEQIDGSSEASDRVDVYAVGVVLFLMLTGSYPFGDASARRTILSHVLVDAPDARTIEASVPAEMADLLAHCLRKPPQERPCAEDVARALGAFADAHGVAMLAELETTGLLRDVDASGAERQVTVASGKRAAP
jgi:serine/threonine-protein kinase